MNDKTQANYRVAVLALIVGWPVVVGCNPSKPPAEKSASTLATDTPLASSSTEATQPNLPPGLSLDAYRAAEKDFQQRFPDRKPTHEETLLMAGDRAASEHRLEVALACYRAIPTSAAQLGLVARLQEGLLLVENNLAAQAEGALQAYLESARVADKVNPQDVVSAFKWLTFILSVEIRLEERKPLLAELHQIQLADPLDSKQLYFPQLLILNSPAGRTRIESFLKNDPQNVRLRLARARYKTLEGQFDTAIELLEQLHKEYAADKGIAAALLEAYFENGQTEKMPDILERLPAYEESEPWLLTRMRGEVAYLDKDYSSAEKHFLAALQQDPTYAPCQIGLSRIYASRGDQAAQQDALKRSALMADIRVNLTKVQPDAAAAAAELSEKCSQLGLKEASEAFATHARNIARSQAAAPAAPVP